MQEIDRHLYAGEQIARIAESLPGRFAEAEPPEMLILLAVRAYLLAAAEAEIEEGRRQLETETEKREANRC